MRIVSWNCNGKFREKFMNICNLNPDIWMIQECENPAEVPLIYSEYHSYCQNNIWLGDLKHKGIAVFAKPEFSLSEIVLDKIYRGKQLKWFLPVQVDNQFNLLCVWNHKNNCGSFDYIGQFWLLLEKNKKLFDSNLIVGGDFNSNTIWDEWDRWWNHSDCVNELLKYNLHSLYHSFTEESQGKESKPTFFLQRNQNKPYHIDYFFAKDHFINNSQFMIGKYEDWILSSDHLPLILDLDHVSI
jgi:exonuclease III